MTEFLTQPVGEAAYIEHVKQTSGPDAEPTVPFGELSDMAIQMYAAEAAMIQAASDERGVK